MSKAAGGEQQAGLIRALGLRDVAAMTLVGVVSLRWISRAARMGAPSVMLWFLAWGAFFVPLAAAACELSSRYPDQGGLYAWTRRAFGPTHAFLCGWCLWVNNLFWYPSLLLFGAANAAMAVGVGFPGLADSNAFAIVFVLAAIWFSVVLNIAGLSKSKWLQNLGSMGTWLPAALLIAFGAVALTRFGSATSFAPDRLLPRQDFWSTISLWSAICFAFSGLEISAQVGQEVRNPKHTLPRGILIAGVFATLIYVAGSVSVLVSIPASELSERVGIAEAIELVSGRIGMGSLSPYIGALLALGSLAMMNSWFAGSSRVPFAAGVDRVMPAAFARLHERHRTPHVVLIVQGGAASVLLLISVFFSASGSGTSLQEAYDIMVNLTILIYFIPYLYLFMALIKLGQAPESAASFRIAWGRPGRWVVALAGGCATAVSLGLVFVPPPGTAHVLNYELNLIGQGGAILAAGLFLYRKANLPPANIQGRQG